MALSPEMLLSLTANKRYSQLIVDLYNDIGDNQHRNQVANCCNDVFVNQNGEFFQTFFCKNRFCPICSERKSQFLYARTINIVKEMLSQGYAFISCTLTVPNPKGEDLRSCVKNMIRAYQLLFGSSGKNAFPAVKGTLRNLEISYNAKEKNFHPHLHCLLCVDREYVKLHDKHPLFFTGEQVAKRWSECLGYTAIDVDLQYIKTYGKTLERAIAEFTKYALKHEDFQALYENSPAEAAEAFRYLTKAFYRVCQFFFTGIMRKYASQFSLEEYKNFHFIQFIQDNETITYYQWIPCTVEYLYLYEFTPQYYKYKYEHNFIHPGGYV